MSTNNNQNNNVLFSEAPASWKTHCVDPKGFECQFTLRCDNVMEMLGKIGIATAFLVKYNCQPYSYHGNNRTYINHKHGSLPKTDPEDNVGVEHKGGR